LGELHNATQQRWRRSHYPQRPRPGDRCGHDPTTTREVQCRRAAAALQQRKAPSRQLSAA